MVSIDGTEENQVLDPFSVLYMYEITAEAYSQRGKGKKGIKRRRTVNKIVSVVSIRYVKILSLLA